MNEYNYILKEMISKYKITDEDSAMKAIIEIMQEITLCGLGRSNFFNFAAFYGGTCLRVFFNLPRFSEDLDFSLDIPIGFELKNYKSYIDNEFASLGLDATFEISEKAENNNIKRGYIRGNAIELMNAFGIEEKIIKRLNHNQLIKVKFEVDSVAPFFSANDIRFGLMPSPYPVRIYDIESLFACKISAVLCRNWQTRFKGRDFFDYIFYIKNNVKVSLVCVEDRIKADGIDLNNPLTLDNLKKMLCERFDMIDFESAKKDVSNFIKDKSQLDIWSADFFKSITQKLEASENHVLRLCSDEEIKEYVNRTRDC